MCLCAGNCNSNVYGQRTSLARTFPTYLHYFSSVHTHEGMCVYVHVFKEHKKQQAEEEKLICQNTDVGKQRLIYEESDP